MFPIGILESVAHGIEHNVLPFERAKQVGLFGIESTGPVSRRFEISESAFTGLRVEGIKGSPWGTFD